MQSIPYQLDLCSPEAAKLITGSKLTPNPMGERERMIPINKLRVGESLFFNYGEIVRVKITLARECAQRYNKHYDDMFAIVRHEKKLEIVRVK